MKSRRAVSPILAVIILIAIAVVGGAFLSNAQSQYLNTAFSGVEYRVSDLRLEKHSNSCFLVAKIYNSGTEPIILTKINATLDSGEAWFPTHSSLSSTIKPTQALDLFLHFSGNVCGNFTTSNTYSFGVEASSESSSYKTVVPLKVKEVKE
ncbi:MAG TPA: archaellin/type IV pilin N-terminal domain-containing protein [Candidatus Nitrosotenuis sp.]|nr:archaellin/type IV pilin N-terminal domain-containing protein [Candidatus Nitrosotenuis sp.]